MPSYTIARVDATPSPDEPWDGAVWAGVPALAVEHFHERSKGTHPRTQAKLLHDGAHIAGIFRVEDRWVRSVTTDFMGPVCTDSCVEFFFEPRPAAGYFNLEMNAGGTLHASFVENPVRGPDGAFGKWTPFAEADGAAVRVRSSLPAVVEPEIDAPTVWTLAFAVPVATLERYAGPLGDLGGQTWRANLYKCGDRTSRPHWASWAPIGELDFHAPEHFAPVRFEA